VTSGDDAIIAQLVSQVRKLVDVVDVIDLTRGEHVERELLLVKCEVAERDRAAASAAIAAAGGRLLSSSGNGWVIEITASGPHAAAFLESLSQAARVIDLVRSGPLAI
jgi:acetolactate synthase-1/3 small subunit